MLSRRRILGLAVGSESVTAVELSPLNGGANTCRAGRFAFPDAVGLADPQVLGRALRQFLKQRGFTASRCVIGLDAHWLTARDKPLPAGLGDQAAQALALVVEREFASDLKDLVFDYAPGEIPRDRGKSALLVAAPRQAVEQLTAMAQAAGLKAEAVTSSTLALAAGVKPSTVGPGQERIVFRVFESGAELLTDVQGVRTMRPLLCEPPEDGDKQRAWLDRLLGDLRRVVLLLPQPSPGQTRELVIWNEARLDEKVFKPISETLGVRIRTESVPEGIHTNGLPDDARQGQFCAAAAVALAGLRGQQPPVDFLHSRLAKSRKPLLTRKLVWSAAVTGVVLLAVGLFAWDWHLDQAAIAEMRQTASQLKPHLERANLNIERTEAARTWHDRRPGHLECMMALTKAFPVEGRVWAKQVTILPEPPPKDPGGALGNGSARRTGRWNKLRVTVLAFAAESKAGLDVLDRLKANPRIERIKSDGLRATGKGGKQQSFSITYLYDGSGR